MVKVYFYDISNSSELQLWSQFKKLPLELQKLSMNYKSQEGRIHYLIGKLLLLKMLIEEGYDKTILNSLMINKFGRPYFNSDLDFNISHSGNIVICAISKKNNIGIDIEKCDEILFSEYKSIFTSNEYEKIINSNSPRKMFYEFWVKKEATIKAVGEGLTIPLREISIKKNRSSYKQKTWYLYSLNVVDDYIAFLATENKSSVEIKKLTLL